MSTSVQDRTAELRSILSLETRKAGSRQKKAAPRGGLVQSLQPNALWGGKKSIATSNQDSQQSQPLLSEQDQQDQDVSSNKKPGRSSDFSRSAAHVAQGITATMTKLERLAQLARQRSLLDGRAGEIQKLTGVIKTDIDGLNINIQTLQKKVNNKVNPSMFSSTPEGQMTEDERSHNSKVVVMLQESLMGVGSSFRDVLEVRTKNMQMSSSRSANLITAGPSPAVGGSLGLPHTEARTDSPLYATSLRRGLSSQPPRPASASNAGPFEPESDLLTLEPPIHRPASTSHQLQLMEEGQTSSQYLQERGDAIATIEKTIQDLGHIFMDLSRMVTEQGVALERIDANTAEVVENVAGAHRELVKYWQRVSSNRWLIVKMGGILMVFFLLWVLISG